jgi:hypothetical protein
VHLTRATKAVAVAAATLIAGLAVGTTASPAAAAPAQPRLDVAALANSRPVPIAQAVTALRAKQATQRNSGTVAASGCQAITITSAANGRYTSAEVGRTGNGYATLRARATAVGPWEQFALCTYGSGYVIASLENGDYVSAELGWSGNGYGTLRARATSIGPWEQFSIQSYGSNIAIRSTASGDYVSSELGWSGDANGTLRARATSVGPWEEYY